MTSTFRRHFAPPAALAAVLLLTGCTSIVEDVSKHLLANDLKTLQHDHCVFEHDLALFRGCLTQRGGTCQGSSTTAVPHSSQHTSGQSVQPVQPGSSPTLARSIADLPANHPARTAYRVMTHSVTRQAAELHNHLRGHDTGSGSSSGSGESSSGTASSAGQGPVCGSEPTHTTHLKLHHLKLFQEHLLASIGHAGWEALANQCDKLLAEHKNAPDPGQLKAECRSAAFIRKYIGAYLRDGEFIKVDLSLSDEVARLNQHATDITRELQGIQSQITPILAQLPPQKATALSSSDAATVAYQTAFVVSAVHAQLRRDYQVLVANDVLQLEQDNRRVAALANALLSTNTAEDATQLATALTAVSTELTHLHSAIHSEDGRLDQAIDHAVSGLNSELSNVFKVQSAGFVSRDLTYGARLPTLELTIDPDFGHFKTELTEVDADASAADSGKRLTGRSSFSHLGIVTQNTGGFDPTGGSIGAELVRVFFEALFDAHEGLPALSQSGTKATGLTLKDPYKLPLFNDPTGNVSAADLQRITHVNTAVTLQTRLVMGRVIAGIGPFSLNNQPLEDLITEIVVTSVRKATEKATWCWYACNLDHDVEKLRKDAGKAVGDAVKKGAKDLEKKVEHVKVRFKVSP